MRSNIKKENVKDNTLSLLNRLLFSEALRGKSTRNTIIQESLTCFYFDGCFNKGLPITIEQFTDYLYESHGLIEEICNIIATPFKEFEEVANDYIYCCFCQCKSFENWLNKNPNFNGGKNYIYLRYSISSPVSIFKGKITNKGIQIIDKIKRQQKLLKLNKDRITKSDIFMVKNTPGVYDDILNTNLTTEYDKGNILGISLKEINEVVEPKICERETNISNINLQVKGINFLPFLKNIEFNPKEGIINAGGVSSYIYLKVGDIDYTLNLRGDSVGETHILTDPISAYTKSGTKAEFKITGEKNQSGQAQLLLTRWGKDMGLSFNDLQYYNFKEISRKLLNDLSNILNFPQFTPEAASLLDFLSSKNNNDIIKNIFNKVSYITDKAKIDSDPDITKWKFDLGFNNIDNIGLIKGLFEIVKWKYVLIKTLINYNVLITKHNLKSDEGVYPSNNAEDIFIHNLKILYRDAVQSIEKFLLIQ